MSLLTKTELETRINSGKNDQIFVDPLLSSEQVGSVSLDLRLGYDFLVSVLNQNPSIDIVSSENLAGPDSFFQATRRDLGDIFLIHPSQAVLATSLEYVGLPNNVYASVVCRSSYQRLGINVSSLFQPGFRGCLSLELYNHSNVPVELIVGSRIIQACFFENEHSEAYLKNDERRKYIGNVRPTLSKAPLDADLKKLSNLSQRK